MLAMFCSPPYEGGLCHFGKKKKYSAFVCGDKLLGHGNKLFVRGNRHFGAKLTMEGGGSPPIVDPVAG